MKRIIMIALMIILAIPVLSHAMDVTLQWDSNTEPDLAGYEIHYDIDSGDPYEGTDGNLQDGTGFPSPITMTLAQDENPDLDVVEFTVYGLPNDAFHYFAVKAVDDQGLKSAYSNEVNTSEIVVLLASAGAGGTIAPVGSVNVEIGSEQTFTITSDPGYVITSVVVDGEDVGPVTSYTFTNVTVNHTIQATFEVNAPPESPGGLNLTITITQTQKTTIRVGD